MKRNVLRPSRLWTRSIFKIGASLLAAMGMLVSTGAKAVDLTDLSCDFKKKLTELQVQHGLPGAVAAFVLPDGRDGVFAVGLADRQLGLQMKTYSRMPSASIGKTFVAATALALVREGKLALDVPISKYLGDEKWFHRLANADKITLRQLLNHTSGLIDHVYTEEFAQAIGKVLGSKDPDLDWYLKPVETVALILDKPGKFAPGEGFSYTDTGYLVVGLIIEKVTQNSYFNEMWTRFILPLQLHATVPATSRDIPGIAVGYLNVKNPLGLPPFAAINGKMLVNPTGEWTGGGLITNPIDLAHWAQALYQGRVLDADLLREMTRGVTRDAQKGISYGLACQMTKTRFGQVWGHNGWFPGYRGLMAYFPDHRFAIAMQVNTDDIEGDKIYEICRDALAAVVVNHLQGSK